jgi:hypothetical protein
VQDERHGGAARVHAAIMERFVAGGPGGAIRRLAESDLLVANGRRSDIFVACCHQTIESVGVARRPPGAVSSAARAGNGGGAFGLALIRQ